MKCRVDTGADVTVIPKDIYETALKHKVLKPFPKTLRGPDRKPLETLEYFTSTIHHEHSSVTEDIYVLQQGTSFLSSRASTSLGIVKLLVGGVYSDVQRRCIPVKSTDLGGSLPIFLPSYRQPTDLPQSTDFYRFFRRSTEF